MTDQETGAPPPDPNDPATSSQVPAPGETPESDQQENDPRGEGIEGGSAPTGQDPDKISAEDTPEDLKEDDDES